MAGGMLSFASSGFPSYIVGALIAYLQGKVVGKFMKNPGLGENMAVGGYTYVALKALNDLLPSFASFSPFGVSGLGLITSANSWGPPWVPVGGSMTKYVKPGGVPMMIAPPATTGMHGLGRVRRVGRLA